MEYMVKKPDDHFHMYLQNKKGQQFPDICDADILFYNRFIEMPADELYRMKQATGCKIVVDLDDYWELYPGHAIQDAWKQYRNGERIQENIAIADLVLCTNLQLRDEIVRLNRNVVVVPNAIAFDRDQFIAGETIPSGKTRFIYAGGSSHQKDVELLKGKFNRIRSDTSIKNNAIFILAGFNPGWRCGTVWHKMSAIFNQTGCSRILPGTGFDKYMSLYNEADVALVPLVDNKFNRNKSVLKILEASVKNMPCIVSAVWPYLELQDYPGILWVHKPDDWLTHIRFCIKNPGWVKEQGIALNKAIRDNYHLDTWNQTRYQLFEHLTRK